MEQWEPSLMVGGNARGYSPFGKQFDGFLQSLTHSSHEPAIVILGVYANELKIVST